MNKHIIREKAIIVDIDGTLTVDSLSIPFKPNSTIDELRKTKNKFYEDVDYYNLIDRKTLRCKSYFRPVHDVIALVEAMRQQGVVVIFMTAREDYKKNRENTLYMLRCYFKDKNLPMFMAGDYPSEECLLMRPEDDFRPNHVVKRDLYETYIKNRFDVLFAIDDEINNVNMFKEEGITVLQPHFMG